MPPPLLNPKTLIPCPAPRRTPPPSPDSLQHRTSQTLILLSSSWRCRPPATSVLLDSGDFSTTCSSNGSWRSYVDVDPLWTGPQLVTALVVDVVFTISGDLSVGSLHLDISSSSSDISYSLLPPTFSLLARCLASVDLIVTYVWEVQLTSLVFLSISLVLGFGSMQVSKATQPLTLTLDLLGMIPNPNLSLSVCRSLVDAWCIELVRHKPLRNAAER